MRRGRTGLDPPDVTGLVAALAATGLALHSHPHFTILRLGALFFNDPKCIGPAVVSDDDARVSHGPLPPLAGARACAAASGSVLLTRRPCSRRRGHSARAGQAVSSGARPFRPRYRSSGVRARSDAASAWRVAR